MTPVTACDAAIAQNLKQFLLVLSVSLSVATLPRIFSWLRQIPYTLLLVIVGLGLALANVRLVNLSPDLILLIFLPPILFEAAWNMKWSALKQDLLPVSLFAVGGVVISIAVTALGLNQLASIPLTTALLVGACLAATDSVSVISLFRELGVGKRLTSLMEGECLFNDGASVVAFSFLLSFAAGTSVPLSTTVAHFLAVVGIGVGVGGLISLGISYVTQRVDLPLVEQSLTLVSAYGIYLLVEELGGSGVIGVVTTGLVLGNFGSRGSMNPHTRIALTEFWEFLAFFINSIVFLLIGDQVQFARLVENWGTTAVAIGAIILARAIAVYGLGSVSNWLANSQISLQNQTVVWWGGLRGSISIALALSVPANLPGREEIIANVFGAVLFTLLVQGLTAKSLLEKLGLLDHQTLLQTYTEATARREALQRVLQHLEVNSDPGTAGDYSDPAVLVQAELNRLEAEIDQLQQHPQLQAVSRQQLHEELLAIEAGTYAELLRDGRLDHQLSPLLQDVFKPEEQRSAKG